MSAINVAVKTPDGQDVMVAMTKCDGPGCDQKASNLPPEWYTLSVGAGFPSYGQFHQWACLTGFVAQHPHNPTEEPVIPQ